MKKLLLISGTSFAFLVTAALSILPTINTDAKPGSLYLNYKYVKNTSSCVGPAIFYTDGSCVMNSSCYTYVGTEMRSTQGIHCN